MSKPTLSNALYQDISKLIEAAKTHVAGYANSALVLLYWQIGARTNSEILKESRAGYGEQVISQLSEQLKEAYGAGFDRPNLSRMVKFSKIYADQEICVTLSQQLSWSHFIKLISIDEPQKRDYYTEMCRLECWSVRQLRDKVDGMLYERTALSKKPEEVVKKELAGLRKDNTITPNLVFQDPYFLDFTGLNKNFSEVDLEDAILDELTKFLQEFGNDFCFMARQKRMSTKNKDRYLDLLFFHRALRRMVAVELKIGAFEPAHKGQMEWYLNWLDKNERKPGEEKPLGIILCADKDQEDVEYLELDNSGIHVAQYLTELPPKEILEERLRNAISVAQERDAHLKLLKKDEDE